MKELLYVRSIFNKGNTKLKINLPIVLELKILQQELGDWHDLKILLEEVKRIIPTSEALIESIDLDKNTLHEDILGKIVAIESLNIYK